MQEVVQWMCRREALQAQPPDTPSSCETFTARRIKWLRHAADPFPTPRQGGGPPLMRKVRQRHVLWVPKMGVKINIKCSKNMTKSVYPPKCLPCITGYIQTMFSPLHFHRLFSIKTVPKRCLKMDPHFSMPRVIRVGFATGEGGS